jgi:hypothetical protein
VIRLAHTVVTGGQRHPRVACLFLLPCSVCSTATSRHCIQHAAQPRVPWTRATSHILAPHAGRCVGLFLGVRRCCAEGSCGPAAGLVTGAWPTGEGQVRHHAWLAVL